jgi:putative CocE/NonD family hydrolase
MRKSGATAAARSGQRLVVGPWNHAVPFQNLVGAVDFGFRSGPVSVDIDGQQLRFFDQWLKGKDGADGESQARIFVMGVNQWRDEKEWPLAGTEYRRYYLHSRGRANSMYGDGALDVATPGAEPPDSYLYNPLDPVPTVGGGLCCYPGALQGGAFDQGGVEHRADVLVYSTEPLADDMEVTGPIELTLFASSSATDTDFTAKLVDVSPCGAALNLTDGIIRARWRTSRETPAMLTPGKVEEFRIDMWSTANVFKKGHRIRLEVSSSNFPRFDCNPNTGHELFADAEVRPAMQSVRHDREFASFLTLPIIPARA